MEERCKRAGCSGKIVDGVCEDCGRAPAGKSLLSGVAPKAGAPAAGSQRSAVSSAVPSASSSSALSGRTGSGRSGRTGSRGSRSSARMGLGAGLVSLPPLPSMDPLNSLMADPVVPERKRFCNGCQAKLSHERGFCPMCGQEYSFQPTLKPGDMVAGQYEVKGAMAYGGLGWIYLGWDKTLNRWVVLKGLLNSKDEASATVAVAERQFLAAVKHAKIVSVYNFVQHGTEGYIVMEYVGGKTLKAIRQEKGPLPVTEAIAYIYAILPAFAYLERQGLIYCDFKPDNIMLEDDDVKLIDMGGVRRADDPEGDIYGTKGYSAPEASEFPSFVSDLYTLGRTLAILMMDFKFQGQYEFTLPQPAEQPLFAQHDSLYRFLLRATHENPDGRFQSADEMAEQLLGVLREIVAESSTPRPAESTLFTGDLLDAEQDAGDAASTFYRQLPALKMDTLDPAAAAILMTLTLGPQARAEALEKAIKNFPASAEAPLRLANQAIDSGAFDVAESLVRHIQEVDPFDWRVAWYRGRMYLHQMQGEAALKVFDQVYAEVPGELAPKVAIAFAFEQMGNWKAAIPFYDRVTRVDPSFTSAAFGLARCRTHLNDRTGAAEAYRRVPQTSSAYVRAQVALTRALLLPQPAPPGVPELVQASEAIQGLSLEGMALHKLSAELLLTALYQVEKKTLGPAANEKVLGHLLQVQPLRAGAERELRACAHHAATPSERLAFVDQANRVRPFTII